MWSSVYITLRFRYDIDSWACVGFAPVLAGSAKGTCALNPIDPRTGKRDGECEAS